MTTSMMMNNSSSGGESYTSSTRSTNTNDTDNETYSPIDPYLPSKREIPIFSGVPINCHEVYDDLMMCVNRFKSEATQKVPKICGNFIRSYDRCVKNNN